MFVLNHVMLKCKSPDTDPLSLFLSEQIQDLAIRCIQKNIKKNRGVKGWPWWKLFTTVRPLVEVQLTEEQIRGKDVSGQFYENANLTVKNNVYSNGFYYDNSTHFNIWLFKYPRGLSLWF